MFIENFYLEMFCRCSSELLPLKLIKKANKTKAFTVASGIFTYIAVVDFYISLSVWLGKKFEKVLFCFVFFCFLLELQWRLTQQ